MSLEQVGGVGRHQEHGMQGNQLQICCSLCLWGQQQQHSLLYGSWQQMLVSAQVEMCMNILTEGEFNDRKFMNQKKKKS